MEIAENFNNFFCPVWSNTSNKVKPTNIINLPSIPRNYNTMFYYLQILKR